MGRMYVTHFKEIAVTAVQDLFEILAATGKPIDIHGFCLSQRTETGDTQEEGLTIVTNRGVGATSGSGGSTHTPATVDVADPAAGATVEINNTTIMSAGTITQLEVYEWNVRAPLMQWYPPECRPHIVAGDRWTLELETAPADSITMSGTVWFEEK